MNEKKAKVLTLIGKISGVLIAIAGKTDFIPEKYAWVGVLITIISSTFKDIFMFLGDLWDDGKIDKSFTGSGSVTVDPNAK